MVNKLQSVHETLLSIGLIDKTDPYLKANNIEVSYSANHLPQEIHDILIGYGYKMVTHTSSGLKMKPFIAYKCDGFKSCNIVLNHSEGKVDHIIFDYRYNNYD